MPPLRFRCPSCRRIHEGLPEVSFDAPIYYSEIPEKERRSRVSLSTELCVIEKTDFFVRGCLEVQIKETGDFFAWGVWVSLSRRNFNRYARFFDTGPPAGEGPYFGWLSSRIPRYPDTVNLKTQVRLRPRGERPRIELEPTDHPLAVHQREGIALKELLHLIKDRLHGPPGKDRKRAR